ncbi:MAG: hypothetical protein ACR2KV_17520, partial [Solirubrobacteraceae bacterium]
RSVETANHGRGEFRGHQRGEKMAASGENRWPYLGRNRWPLTLALGIERRFFERGDQGALSGTAAVAYAFMILGSGAGLGSALVALAGAGSPNRTIGAVATFGVVEAITCSLTLIVAYSANNLGVFEVLRRGQAGPHLVTLSDATRSLGTVAASIAFGAFSGIYFFLILSADDPGTRPRVALFPGTLGVALSGVAFWVGSDRRTTAVRGMYAATLAVAWLGLSVLLGLTLSGPYGYGSFAEVAISAGLVLALPVGALLGLAFRHRIVGHVRRRKHERRGPPPRALGQRRGRRRPR